MVFPIKTHLYSLAPGDPRSVYVGLEDDTIIFLSWMAPMEHNGEITEYEVSYAGYSDHQLCLNKVIMVICVATFQIVILMII